MNASDQLGAQLRQAVDLGLHHRSDGGVDIRQRAALRQDYLHARPGAIDRLSDAGRQVNMDLEQLRRAGMDEPGQPVAEHAVDLAGVDDGVFAGRCLSARRPGERDEAIGAIAPPDLAGVGLLGRGPRDGKVNTIASMAGVSRLFSRQSTVNGTSRKRWPRVARIASLRRRYAASEDVSAAISGMAMVMRSRSSSRTAKTFTS